MIHHTIIPLRLNPTVLLQKLIIVQLIRNLINPKILYHVQSCQALVIILTHIYHTTMFFSNILPFKCTSPKCPLLGLQLNFLICFPSLLCVLHASHFLSLDFIILIIYLAKRVNYNPHYAFISGLVLLTLSPIKIYTSVCCSEAPSPYIFPLVGNTKLHTHVKHVEF